MRVELVTPDSTIYIHIVADYRYTVSTHRLLKIFATLGTVHVADPVSHEGL